MKFQNLSVKRLFSRVAIGLLISASLAELVLVTLQDTHGRQSSIPSAPSPSLPASLVRQERSLSESAPMSLVLFILYCSIRL